MVSHLKQLLIFPGDWHTLKTYQNVIMKAYFTAGLQEIAKASGYNGMTLQSLQTCGNFKRTHVFILKVWEALYRVQLEAFIQEHNKQSEIDNIYQQIKASIASNNDPHDLLERVKSSTIGMATNFYMFIQKKGETDSTWKFWGDFVFSNCFAYVSLFLAIRSSNWNLRIASLKEMTPLFAAFDRGVYERIIPHHLADILVYPPEILANLTSGCFTVHITGEAWRAVALDEAHETCINKDLKDAITYPTEAYLQKTSLFMNYRIKSTKNFLHQLFPDVYTSINSKPTIVDNTCESAKRENDIVIMTTTILDNNLLPRNFHDDRGLLNTFTGQVATLEQRHDLLNFRKVGEEATQS